MRLQHWNDSGTQRRQPTAIDGDLNSAEVPAKAVIWRLTAINGNPGRPTVTPEVAGSSPVAPVSRSACKQVVCVVFSGAQDRFVAQSRGPDALPETPVN